MKHLIARCAYTAALCAHIQCAAAQSAPATAAPAATASAGAAPAADDQLNEIVVTATRNPQPASQALEPVIVIDRPALENSLAIDVGDVLRYNAGLDIGRTGGPGQPLTLFIRGANSDQSIIMIDGVRINAGTIGIAPLQNLAAELFDRIEIVEGPRSAIYGTDAIGGVVNLITRTGGPSGADAMLDYGRYGTGEFAVDGHYTDGDTSVRAALTGQQSSGFPPIIGDTLDSGYKNLSGTATASAKIAGVDVGALYWQSTGTTQYAEGATYNSDYTAYESFAALDERFTNSALAAHASGDLTAIWHARLLVSRILDDLRQNQLDIYNLPPVGDFDHTSRDTVDLQNDVKIAGAQVHQLVTFGTILTKEQTNSLSYGTGYAIDTKTQTYYVQDQLDAGPHRLLLAGGFYHHPAFGDHATWNAEYGYSLTTDTLLLASAGTAFRAPSATDRFGFGGTPDLKPESSRNFELGVKSRLGDSQVATFAMFQNTIDELIEFVPDPDLLYGGENRNIGRARIRGMEAGWEWHADPWSVRALASLQDPRDLDADAQDSELLRRTKHSFTLSAARRIGLAEFGLDVLDSGAREDVNGVSGASGVHDGGYVLASVWSKVTLTPAWSVTARLDNAFDRRYELANGYNSAGRAASIATRYSFR